MAGETRRQRRDARRAAGEEAPGRESRAPHQPGDPGLEASAAAAVAVPPARRGGFVRESWAELHKVEWPNRSQVIQGTIVVLIACAIVGAYLWAADKILRPFVDFLIG